MRPFSLLVKPASADCNLRCEYCFYLEKCALYPDSKRHRMTDAVLEQMIKSYMATPQPTYAFGWQGGEPTLMGLDFFRKVTALQQQYGRKGVSVANGLQTNATLIDDALAEHLGTYKFLIGCSLDGPPKLHDRFRRTVDGRPTHADVMAGIASLKRHKVEFNILVLVSQANVRHAKAVYRYLVDQGFLFHQYIPCVEVDAAGKPRPFSISGPEWGTFMCEIFDQWYPNDTFTVSVRHFDGYLAKLVDDQATACTLGRNCCQYFVVEHNGDIFPCDFFVEPPLKIGNVMDTPWIRAQRSTVYRDFGKQKSAWNDACHACDCLDLCSGDCLKHRLCGGMPPQHLSLLCEGNQAIIRHARDGLNALADRIKADRTQQARFFPH